MTDNVVPLKRPEPKQLRKTYKKQTYYVKFIPATKKWLWRVERTHVTVFEDEADTQIAAIRAAEKFIDGLPSQ
jgi:hypothetical protein